MTEELKAMLKAAKTDEEAKEILLANKSELTDEELEKVNGGASFALTKMLWCITLPVICDPDIDLK